MDKLFSGNVILIYFFAIITIINYAKFQENQKIFIIYISTFLIRFFDLLSTVQTIVTLIVTMYIYIEYLTEDNLKLKYLRKSFYKLLDFGYRTIFQYSILWIIFSIILCSYKVKYLFNNIFILKIISIIIITIGLHRLISPKFIVKSAGQLLSIIERDNILEFNSKNFKLKEYQIITEIEDKLYFVREDSYTPFSIGFIKEKYNKMKSNKEICKNIILYLRKNNFVRGFSTLEMQLIRNIGIELGYDCIIRRKIYEIIYSNIIFKSVYNNYKSFYYNGIENYKKYILYLYFKNVSFSVKGTTYKNIFSVLGNNPIDWDLERFFVCCCGYKKQKDTLCRVNHLKYVAEKYNLNFEKIENIALEKELLCVKTNDIVVNTN